MRTKIIYTVVFIVLIFALCLTSFKKRENELPSAKETNANYYDVGNISLQKDEVRAAWVTYMTLDMRKTEMGYEDFKEKFYTIVKKSKDFGLNTLIVHVRPFADSFYPSNIFPWSHLLSGKRGKDPGYDPLKYMLQECHNQGIKFHAWINPFRISFKEGEMPREYENIALKGVGGAFFNPTNEEARRKIIDGIKEIVTNYDIDGVHFDDYFYPKDDQDLDSSEYEKYKTSAEKRGIALSKKEWRQAGVNSLVSGTYSAIKKIKPHVKFGISPQCNFENDKLMGADVVSWSSIEGFVDYLCPQTYVNFEHPLLPFDAIAKRWKDTVTCKNVELYYGIGVYKADSDADNGSWHRSSDILKREVEFVRSLGANGFCFYSWDSIFSKENSGEVINVMKTLN